VDLRAVVEAALAKNAKSAAKAGGVVKARAQAAGAAANSEVPDFEVAGSSPDWSENTPTEQPSSEHNKPK